MSRNGSPAPNPHIISAPLCKKMLNVHVPKNMLTQRIHKSCVYFVHMTEFKCKLGKSDFIGLL